MIVCATCLSFSKFEFPMSEDIKGMLRSLLYDFGIDDFFQSLPPDKQLKLCNTCNDAIRDMIVFKERAQKSFSQIMKYWRANMSKQTTGNAVSVPSSSQIANVIPLHAVEIEEPKEIKYEETDPLEIDITKIKNEETDPLQINKTVTEIITASNLLIDIKERTNPDSFNSKPIVNNSTAVAANRNNNLNCNFVINKVSTQTNGNSNSNIAPVVLSSAPSQVVNKKLKIVKLDDRGNIEDIGEGVMCRSPSVSKDLRERNTNKGQTKWYINIVSREEVIKYMEERRNHPDFLKAPYKCVSCVTSFPNRWVVETHKEASHSEEFEFTCFACQSTFKDLNGLNTHYDVHMFDKYVYRCITCEFTSRDVEYIQWCHVCPNAGSKPLPPKDPNTMKLTTSSSLYYCPKCEYISCGASKLILHYTDTHKNNPMMQCEECGKCYKNKPDLRFHVKTVHRGKKKVDAPVSVYCKVCDKLYTSKWYDTHVKHKHTPRDSKFECNECGKKLSSAKQLENHKKFHELMKKGVPNASTSEYRTKEWYIKIVTREEILKKMEEGRNKPEFMEAPYKCVSCVRVFGKEQLLEQHKKACHTEDTEFVCFACRATFVNFRRLNAHFHVHTMDSCIYYCTTCEFETKHIQFMRDHICINDGSEALPPKDQNTMKLSSSRSLYYCPKCEFISCHANTLILHYITTHKNSPNVQCGECGKIFKNKQILRYHRDTAHRGKKRGGEPVPIYCTLCDKWYARKSAYYVHMKNKHAPGDRKFECNECGKKLLSAKGLKDHKEFHELMKRGVKNHKCSICGNAYYTQKVLRRHIQVKHEKKRTILSRDHVCEVCGMAFFTNRMLKQHSARHSDAKPYKCSFCGETYKYYAALYSHTKRKHEKNRNAEGSPNKKKTRETLNEDKGQAKRNKEKRKKIVKRKRVESSSTEEELIGFAEES